MLATPDAGAYVLVDGNACLRSVLVSDSELRCEGIHAFASSAEIKVRVIQAPTLCTLDAQGRVTLEGTLGVLRRLQRIGLLVGGSTSDGRGFLATAASSSSQAMQAWHVSFDRPVRCVEASSTTGSVFAAGTFQSVTSFPDDTSSGIGTVGVGRHTRVGYILSAQAVAARQSAPLPSALEHGLDGAVTGMVKITLDVSSGSGASTQDSNIRKEWLMVVGSFTSAFHKSSRRRATATAGSTRSSSMVVKGAGLMLWGPPLDPLNSLTNEPEESSWQEVGGEGMPEGAMTAVAIFTGSVSRNGTSQEASTLIFVAGRFQSVGSSGSGMKYDARVHQEAGGLMVLDWRARQWGPLCGVVKRSSSTADASGSPGSAVETSQGCGVRGGDIVAISIVDDTLGAYEVVVGGTFSQAGGGGGAGGVQNTRAIALWNRGTWRSVGSFDGKGCVWALARLGTSLYVGGSFSSINGKPFDNLAMYSGGAWSEVGGGVEGTVFALAVAHAAFLLVGGEFSAAGTTLDRYGLPLANLVRWLPDQREWQSVVVARQSSSELSTPDITESLGAPGVVFVIRAD
jgi:hypothetical protein